VLGGGLIFYAIAALPLSYRARLLLTLGFTAILVYGRASGAWGIPWQFWPAFGAVFMFRLMIYLYDLRFAKGRPGLREFCIYFFPLPNFYFLLFPVVDFQTMRRTYFQRDIHAIAQQGIEWMVRGAIQLALYRLVYHLKPSFTPLDVTSFGSLVLGMVTVYLLYLRVSGQFHLIVGMMHLFGYDLPETHRKYLLASSLTDFWRRINIYWKDFMVKLIYFPIFNYNDGSLEVVREMLGHPRALFGLSDAGAHVGTICDASCTTFMLTHWVRDRPEGRLPLERVVAMLTSRNARYLGLADRGTIAPGMRADLNLIDPRRLSVGTPRIVRDLPSGGRRFLQVGEGYLGTWVAGACVQRDGQVTSARPGRLVRAGR